ncbi:MAG: amino acid ABC transporter ATP-binding protein [Lachnospiraceae bacterium]|nr:amino acid ABC transporter ATP-binding protein [Lachnospiraceae bacterium]
MLLCIEHLNKSFCGNPILSDIAFSVDAGDCVAILGPSGVGKTTLLRCLNFLERAESGSYTLDGTTYDLHHISTGEIAGIRRKTGFVFQEFNLFLNKTVLQNVTEGLTVVRRMPKAEAEETAMRALARVGMEDKKDAWPVSLSGGQKQRAAIARALALSPEILYFDEPTSALDPALTGEVLSVMRNLAGEGMTMLVVTHELAFAREVSNRVLFMDDGRIAEDADSAVFFSQPKTDKAKGFLQRLQKKGENET